FSENLHVNDTVNIGSTIEYSMLELANIIIQMTNSNSKITFLPALPEGDMNRRLPDNSKMCKLLGRSPISLSDGLKKMMELKLVKSE
ncbi:MAG: UDP-glucuronate decarboxylase, partial [Granulosicoccus sp.]